MPNPFERGPEKDPYEKMPCDKCGATGEYKGKTCPKCDGKGWYLKRR